MPDIIRAPFKELKEGRYVYTNPSGAKAVVSIEDSSVGIMVRFSPNRFPTPLRDIPAMGSFHEAPPLNRRQFDELWVGDRFHRINSEGEMVLDEAWTKLSHDTARHHSKSSIALGNQGHGYLGDCTCSFEDVDLVSFIPV